MSVPPEVIVLDVLPMLSATDTNPWILGVTCEEAAPVGEIVRVSSMGRDDGRAFRVVKREDAPSKRYATIWIVPAVPHG